MRAARRLPAMRRGGKTITPRGSDTIEVGDSVIVVAAHSGLRSLNDIFTTRR